MSTDRLRLGAGVGGTFTDLAALGVVKLADTEMVRTLRVISVEHGLDPREFVLAGELGTNTVIAPKASGVLSALGLAVCDVRRHYLAPYLCPLSKADAGSIARSFAKMERPAAEQLRAQGEPGFERRADPRYGGQSFELTVEAGESVSLGGLAARFHDAHERRYGSGGAGANPDGDGLVRSMELLAPRGSRSSRIAATDRTACLTAHRKSRAATCLTARSCPRRRAASQSLVTR